MPLFGHDRSSSSARRESYYPPPSPVYELETPGGTRIPYDPDAQIDPDLQLRVVRTAAASIAESHRSDARREDRKARRKRKQQEREERMKNGEQRMSLFRGMSVKRMLSTRKGKERDTSFLGALTESDEYPGPHSTPADGPSSLVADAPYQAVPGTAAARAPYAESDAASSDTGHDHQPPAGPPGGGGATTLGKKAKKVNPDLLKRRNIYLNVPLPPHDLNPKGDPKMRYPRNKVRTSKYTPLTFLPKNLYEQFHRVANIYFLALVILQVFSIFGAATPQIAMLPLVAILGITALKDGVEDYRRHAIDDGVNNSAVTRLGDWQNVNRPKDRRSLFEKIFGLNPPNRVSKGVRKLREKEASTGSGLTLGPSISSSASNFSLVKDHAANSSTYSVDYPLEELQSVTDSQSFHGRSSAASAASSSAHPLESRDRAVLQNMREGVSINGSFVPSTVGSRFSPTGVVDYDRRTPGTARWERTLWKKLEVGDVVLLREDEQVPADIVVLSTSDPDGACFVETKNLDGETNLKPRKCLKATSGLRSEEDIEHARFYIDSEPPHANLYSYQALLKYSSPSSSPRASASSGRKDDDKFDQVEPVTINELLLRGCALRNTEWVIGLVVFTGSNTKIMLNQGDTPSKRSKIEKETNFNVIMNFVILLAMCVAAAIAGGFYDSRADTSASFYEPDTNPSTSNFANAVVIFASCLILFQNIVPISLYISIEIVKTIQAYFIYQDIDMYYAPLDHPCVPKTWNISDDLGQIEYVFSDKTGTLTQNIMEFKKCSIHGVAYGEGITEAMVGAAKREGKDVGNFNPAEQEEQLNRFKEEMVETMTRSYKNRYFRQDKLTLIAPSLAHDLSPSATDTHQRRRIIDFWRALALCHTALTDRPDSGRPFELDYKAESPDEVALVAAARDVGFVFVSRTNNVVEIEVMGQPERYTPLRVLEFNSTRKRMSVIVREPDGRILMVCKGADSVIYERLADDHDVELKQSTQRDLEAFANAGLRTLCIARRYLSEEEYADWARIHDAACAAIDDREDEIDRANELVEHDLTLLGATALEDKLQVGVPDAIEMLHRAGIKLWILTGDKLQTAIEIGFSCNLLTNDMEIMIISADSEAAARAQIEAACDKIAAAGRPVVVEVNEGGLKGKAGKKKVQRPAPVSSSSSSEKGPSAGFAVVIDGETLRYALDAALKPLFLALTTQCETVVCCRVSPAQKALTVNLVKEGKGAMTLAIGDGANDVAMIQEAHVGVGIAGLEGAQASMSADYAVGQFRYLSKLLLVHGHWSYVRIAEMHSNFFYKNIIWTFTMFWYQFYCSYDATYLYDYTYIMLFNLIFTSLPVILLGALDQDLSPRAIFACPQIYKRGILGLEYTRTKFWWAIFDALYQSAVAFFVPFLVIYILGGGHNQDGYDLNSIWDFGTTIAAGAIITANLYVGLNTKYWSVLIWIVQAFSILSYFVWTAIYSAFPTFTMQNVVKYVFPSIEYWFSIFLVVVICLGPRYTAKAFNASFFPTEVDRVREAWLKGDLKEPSMRDPFDSAREGLRKPGSRSGTPYRDDADVYSEVDLEAHTYPPRSRLHRAASIDRAPPPPSVSTTLVDDYNPSAWDLPTQRRPDAPSAFVYGDRPYDGGPDDGPEMAQREPGAAMPYYSSSSSSSSSGRPATGASVGSRLAATPGQGSERGLSPSPQAAAGLPQIHIQRASGASFDYEGRSSVSHSSGGAGAGAGAVAAGSSSYIAQESAPPSMTAHARRNPFAAPRDDDSFDQAFDEAFGDPARRQPDAAYGSGFAQGHERAHVVDPTDASYHTAHGVGADERRPWDDEDADEDAWAHAR